MGHVMDVQFDADTQRIWALCDNTCGVTSTVLKVSSTGTIVPEVAYSKPASLPVNNIEGFALAPSSTCVDGTKEVLWGDDGIYGAGPGSATEGHALFSGRIDCDLQPRRTGRAGSRTTWAKTKVYNTGDQVSYDGKVFEALWYTSGETPGTKKNGAWAEIAIAADGSTIWTSTRIFNTGDVVVYQGSTFKALWYTRGDAPGEKQAQPLEADRLSRWRAPGRSPGALHPAFLSGSRGTGAAPRPAGLRTGRRGGS